MAPPGANARRISAAGARAHSRKSNHGGRGSYGILPKVLVVTFVGFLAWAYKSIQPPEPMIVGASGGPPVTAQRIKLRDGRHLAYKEHGMSRNLAKYKIVFVHGFHCCRHDTVVANKLSPELFEELKVYVVSFDRPGYGESDPDPKRTPKSFALDIEELADQLGLGSRFYLIGYSMGGQAVWGCLKYIPHRFYYVRAIMANAGSSLMGIGSDCKTRAKDAALNAIQSPLLDIGIERGTRIVWNITSGSDLSLFELCVHETVNAAAEVIHNLVYLTANLVFGVVIDFSLSGQAGRQFSQGDLNVRRPTSIAKGSTFEIPKFLKRNGRPRYLRA